MACRRAPRGVVGERVGELMALTGLEACAHAKPDVLSGVQCQRVAFARALASDAEVILFDEPLSSLDNGLKAGLMPELKRLHRGAFEERRGAIQAACSGSMRLARLDIRYAKGDEKSIFLDDLNSE